MKLEHWNHQRNCAFGIFDPSDLPDLFEEIRKNGVNEAYNEHKREVRVHVEEVVSNAAEECNLIGYINDRLDENIVGDVAKLMSQPIENYDSLVEAIVELSMEDFVILKESYRYELNGQSFGSCKLLLVNKRGYWQLYVTDSDWISYGMRRAALGVIPEVAVDMSRPSQFQVDGEHIYPLTGWPCLCLPPWVWRKYQFKPAPYYARKIDEQGNAIESEPWTNGEENCGGCGKPYEKADIDGGRCIACGRMIA